MKLQYQELENHITMLQPDGQLDIQGVGEIETKFAGYCAGEQPLVLVDLSEVDFLASIGVRLLLLNAKSISSRGGRIALLCPTPTVRATLEVSGIPGLIPIFEDLEAAKAGLLAA